MTAARGQERPLWKLGLLLYPFVTGTVAINLFMLGLIGPAIGLGTLGPIMALVWAVPLGIPSTWLAARWVRTLIDEAEGR